MNALVRMVLPSWWFLSFLLRAATNMFVSMNGNYIGSSSSREESVSMPQSGGFWSAFHNGSLFHCMVFVGLALEMSCLNLLIASFVFSGSFMYASPSLTPRMGWCGFEWMYDLASTMR